MDDDSCGGLGAAAESVEQLASVLEEATDLSRPEVLEPSSNESSVDVLWSSTGVNGIG